ncbi:hypothetical protein EWH70_09510 [Amycolatopsis suaedae]|uniref:RapZ C-terminal domain-containing protein n=2 Tax=Amycolatopsis suaedae TaxID=2510978 RepID=A0A4Q7JCZ9_9PSEU|nr:hypothetical protein EWH70_09510 [Amycolatopsis suaedae]
MPGEPVRFRVESFGYLHGQAPGADVVADVRHSLKDPHVSPELRELTGRDTAVRLNVLAQPGAPELVRALAAAALALRPSAEARGVLVHLAIGCQGGRHRSVVLADAIATALFLAGYGVHVVHTHLSRPVVDRPTYGPDAAAHSAKNAHAAPGLPNHHESSQERAPMVGSDGPDVADDGCVIYTPDELNELITITAGRAVAGALRERADFHRSAASDLRIGTTAQLWHLTEADDLDVVAARELREVGE